MDAIRVLIVDDHPLVRAGLRKLLEAEADMQIVGEAGDAMEGLRRCRELDPDVVVLDIAMPRMGGLEAIGLFKQAVAGLKVVILSMYGEESLAYSALQAGAHGYVLKAGPGADLVAAVRTVQQDAYYFSPQIHAAVIERYAHGNDQAADDDRYRSLSHREKQVFRLLLEGNSTADIARQLLISNKTAEKHRASMARKLGTHNPVEMMKYAVRIGVLDPESLRSQS